MKNLYDNITINNLVKSKSNSPFEDSVSIFGLYVNFKLFNPLNNLKLTNLSLRTYALILYETKYNYKFVIISFYEITIKFSLFGFFPFLYHEFSLISRFFWLLWLRRLIFFTAPRLLSILYKFQHDTSTRSWE